MNRREPTFHAARGGADGHSDAGQADGHSAGAATGRVHAPDASQIANHTASKSSKFSRFITSLQIVGTIIGVPLGLASGYTLYRTNYAPETACQNLRASIISMLDKNVDAATRRMLVRRDIAAFEQSCGTVDPDAHAAFKVLLDGEKAVATVAPVAKPDKPAEKTADKPAVTKPTVEAKTAEAPKVELRPALVEKKNVAAPVAIAAAPAADADAPARSADLSDTRWLDAVRQALVVDGKVEAKPEAKAEPKAEARSEPQVLGAAPTHLKPPRAEPQRLEPQRLEPVVAGKPGEPVLQPAWTATQAAPQVSTPATASAALAPGLPPPEVVKNAPRVGDGNRPVPPGAIPTETRFDANGGSWIAQIPFVGRVIDPQGD